jgi:hypothetical protein
MEEMRRRANECVQRACGFGMLAIICVMVGMSFDPVRVFQAGGILTLMMTFILILKARQALTQNYKKTEMWLYLDEQFRPPEAYAQWAASTVLRDAYFQYAQYTALISIVMWIVALIMALTGLKSTL